MLATERALWRVVRESPDRRCKLRFVRTCVRAGTDLHRGIVHGMCDADSELRRRVHGHRDGRRELWRVRARLRRRNVQRGDLRVQRRDDAVWRAVRRPVVVTDRLRHVRARVPDGRIVPRRVVHMPVEHQSVLRRLRQHGRRHQQLR